MFERLDLIEEKYNKLIEDLASSEIVSNIKKMTELSKEVSDIEEVVKSYKEYKRLLIEEENNKLLLEDKDMLSLVEEELKNIEEEKTKILAFLEEELKPKDKNDSKNVIIEIRGAAGGDEANIFAGDLFRMYLKYCEKENFKVNILSEDSSDTGGFTYVSFAVKGKNVYSKLKYESGAHRVQRIPVTETQGRVHTSTATVLVMPENEEIEVDINMEDIRVDVYRSSGKGGQGVNTTDSAVRLTHIPTNIVVTCQTERSQIQNKETALKVLKARIYEAEQEKRDLELGNERRSKIGTGSRSEKIRTYNYPQNRVTDHRIGFSYMNLDRVMEGELAPIIQALIDEDEKRKLESNEN